MRKAELIEGTDIKMIRHDGKLIVFAPDNGENTFNFCLDLGRLLEIPEIREFATGYLKGN